MTDHHPPAGSGRRRTTSQRPGGASGASRSTGGSHSTGGANGSRRGAPATPAANREPRRTPDGRSAPRGASGRTGSGTRRPASGQATARSRSAGTARNGSGRPGSGRPGQGGRRPAAGSPARRTGNPPRRPASSAAARARARQRRRRRLFPLLAVLVLLSGYLYLDARDVVPGLLTTEDPWPEADPFPTAQTPPLMDVAGAAPAPDEAAAVPSSQSLASLTSALLEDDRVGPNPSVMVSDLLTGEVLLDEGSDRLRAPASALKLLAAVAALEALGPDHRLSTRVVDGGVGQIVLVGGGDITLAADEGNGTGPLHHGGLGDLADQVAEQLTADGVDQVSLSVDDTAFTGPLMGPNWTEGDRVGGWAMPIMPLAVDLGRQEGTNARQEDPALAAGRTFAERLEERGITVVEVARGTTPGEQVLGEVASAPLADLVAYTLQVSDNPLSEVLGRITAQELGLEVSFDGAGQAVLQVLQDLGVEVEGARLVDTSGLSSRSQVHARMLTETVQIAAQRPHLTAAIRGLPVGGLEGTLRDRLTGTAAAGQVAAKTGTLPQVVSLSGLVHTADGRVLAFTVLTGDFERGSGYLARLAIDDWAARIAECGCT